MRTSASLRRCRVSDESTCKRGYSEQLLCLTDLRAASSEFGVGGVPEECPAQVLRDGAFAASRFASLPRHLAPTRALHLPTRTPHHDMVLRCARERPWLTIRHWGCRILQGKNAVCPSYLRHLAPCVHARRSLCVVGPTKGKETENRNHRAIEACQSPSSGLRSTHRSNSSTCKKTGSLSQCCGSGRFGWSNTRPCASATKA